MSDSGIKIAVIAVEVASSMIQYLDDKIARLRATALLPNLNSIVTHMGRAEDLDASVIASNTITHAYMNFGIFACTDPTLAASNINRTLVPGGRASFTAWHDFDVMAPLYDTHRAQFPYESAVSLPFGDEWQDCGFVIELLFTAGFLSEKIEVYKENTHMRFDKIREMSSSCTDLFAGPFRRSWKSPQAEEQFCTRLLKTLPHRPVFCDEGREGVAIGLSVNVWICRK